MALPNIGTFAPPSTAAAATTTTTTTTTTTSLSAEDLSKKVRKPYTITKSRESWTDPEHDKFLEALHLFDRDWKKIEAFIGSKTVIQIRSHAQKYFLKVQKSGNNEHLPPPRPKRKASHPYPQKATKTATPMLTQVAASFEVSPASEPRFACRPDSSSMVRNTDSGPSVPFGTDIPVQTVSLLDVGEGDMRSAGQQVVSNFCCTNNEIIQKAQPNGDMNAQGNNTSSLRVLPDFAQVYSFIGSVFDPDSSGHLQKLKKMDRIDVETVLLLMKNLSINLTSPDFENHKRLLSSYEIDTDKDNQS